MKAVHHDVRELAVLHFLKYSNCKLTCSTFNLSRASLYRFTKKYSVGESLQPKSKTQPRKFKTEHHNFILNYFKKKRTCTVNDVVKSFTRKYKLKISARTVRSLCERSEHPTHSKEKCNGTQAFIYS